MNTSIRPKVPLRTQAMYWILFSVAALAAYWYLSSYLAPFIIAGAIAYLLNPVVNRLSPPSSPHPPISRSLAVGLIAFIFFTAVAIAGLVLVPRLITQVTQLVLASPHIVETIQERLISSFPSLEDPSNPIRQSLLTTVANMKTDMLVMINKALTSAPTLLSIAIQLIVVPVVSLYLLLDWPRVISSADRLTPRPQAATIRTVLKEIDATLSRFFRGMASVCIILGAYYAILLMLTGLQYGLAVGVLSGLLTFIPFVGAILGAAIAIGLALFQFWGEWHVIALVAVIFFSGQLIEGNLLTPKLVGKSIGVHPVWLMLSIAVCAGIFGPTGLILAFPIVSAAVVIARHLVAAYLESEAYTGLRSQDSSQG